MKFRRPQHIIPTAIASLTLLVTIIRYRRRLRSILSSAYRPIRAIHLYIQILTLLAEDTHSFLTSSSSTNTTSSSSSSPPSRPLPRSLQRLLQLAASTDGQSVIRTITTAKFSSPSPTSSANTNGSTSTSDNNNNNNNNNNPDVSSLISKVVVPSLATPHGRIIVATIVSTAVRETIRNFNENSNNLMNVNTNDVMTTLTSDAGRKVIVDVAQTITATALPQILRHQASSNSTATHRQPSSSSLNSSNINTNSRRLSISSVSSPSSNVISSQSSSSSLTTNSDTSGQAKVVVDRFVSKTRTANFWERLAVIAIRDRSLMQDIVRIVVTQAVRTYLLTQAEINGDKLSNPSPTTIPSNPSPNPKEMDKDQNQITSLSSSSPSSSSPVITSQLLKNTNNTKINEGQYNNQSHVNENNSSTSSPIWKLLARSVAFDIQRRIHALGTRQVSNGAASSGWTVF